MRYQEILEACWKGYRKQGMKKKGDRMVPNCVPVSEQEMEEDLKKWFKEKWVRFGPDGKIRGACARGSESEGKPKCLPQSKAHALGKKGRASAAAKKRREDPDPERRGPAKNVATKVREQGVAEGFEYGNQVQHPKYGAGQIIKVYSNGVITVNFPNYPDPVDKKPGVQSNFGPGDKDYQSLKPVAEGMTDYQKRRQRERDIDAGRPVKPLPKNPKTDYQKRREQERRDQDMDEATGDPRFDQMMGRIVDPVATLKQDRVYEEQLEDYVFEFMNEFLTRMDQLGIEVWVDNPRAGEDLTNPKFEQAYEQASLKAVQKFMQRKKLDTNNQRLVAQVKADFDENADQVNPVAGFLGTFMQGFTTLRPGEIDILSKADMFKKPGQQELDEKQDACYRKVKSRYKVWPSAYASGALVQCRKKGAANWGNKKK